MTALTWDTTSSTNVVLSNNGLDINVKGNVQWVANEGKSSGKWYWEITKIDGGFVVAGFGKMSNLGKVISGSSSSGTNVSLYESGLVYPHGENISMAYGVGDTIGYLLDLDNNTVGFTNGVTTYFSPYKMTLDEEIAPYVRYSSGNYTVSANFGTEKFKYPIPEGYRSYDNSQPMLDKTLIFSNGEYKKYRKGNDLYSVPKSNITPTMTENSNPFTVTADNYANSDEPWKVFQAKTASRPFWFATSTKPTNGHWLLIDMNTPRLIGRIGLSSVSISSGNSIGIRNWKLYGSNDGLSFEEIFGAEHMRDATVQYYETGAIKEYRYLRINVLDIYTGGSATADHALIQQVELYEYSLTDVVPPSWRTVSPTLPSLTQFQEEGMDNLSILDRKVQTVLGNPFKMTNEVLGEGKVFKGTVDLKKYFDLRKLEVK